MVNIRENNLNCERVNPWTKEARFINLQRHVMMSKRFDVLSYLSFLAVAVEVLGSWYSLPRLQEGSRSAKIMGQGCHVIFIVISFLFILSHYLFMLAHSRNESMTLCRILPYFFNVIDLPTRTLISLIYPRLPPPPPVLTVTKTDEHFTLDTPKKYRCKRNNIHSAVKATWWGGLVEKHKRKSLHWNWIYFNHLHRT